MALNTNKREGDKLHAEEWNELVQEVQGKQSRLNIVDALDSDSNVDVLSAKQGKMLKGMIDNTTTNVNNVADVVKTLPVGYFYGTFSTEESLPTEITEKGYAYVGTGNPYIIYTFDTDLGWTATENKYSTPVLETDLSTGSEVKAPTTKAVKEGIESIDVTLARSAEDENELTAAQKYSASANINDRAIVSVEVEGVSKLRSMGYKVLKAPVEGDSTTTFQRQLAPIIDDTATPITNTVFEVKDYFDLDGDSFTIPANSKLKIEGGKIDNGTINLNNCQIEGTNGWIGQNLTIIGKPTSEVYADWYCDAEDSDKITKAIDQFQSVKLYPRSYNINKPIKIQKSFNLEGSGVPDFFGEELIGNQGHSASKLIGASDIPCIIRVGRNYVSGVFKGLDFRPSNWEDKKINGINWSTPNGPSRPVEIVNCNFKYLNYGLYVYNTYTISSMQVGLTFNATVATIVITTGSAGDSYTATASLSGTTLTINLTPKSTFTDTLTEQAALQTALNNATFGESSNAGQYVKVTDLYGVITANSSWSRTSINRTSTNLGFCHIHGCNFSGNNWGIYDNGRHAIMGLCFENNNAEQNIYGAIHLEDAFQNVIIRNNLTEGQPTPLYIKYSNCNVVVRGNYFESANAQTIYLYDNGQGDSGQHSILDISGNYSITGADKLTWNIKKNYNTAQTFLPDISQCGDMESMTFVVEGYKINNSFPGHKSLKRVGLSKVYPFTILANADVKVPVFGLIDGSAAMPANNRIDATIPIGMVKGTNPTSTYYTRAGSTNLVSLTQGIWRIGFLCKNNTILSKINFGIVGNPTKFIDGLQLPTNSDSLWVFHDFNVAQTDNYRLALQVYSQNTTYISNVFLYKPITNDVYNSSFKIPRVEMLGGGRMNQYKNLWTNTWADYSTIATGSKFIDENNKEVTYNGTDWVDENGYKAMPIAGVSSSRPTPRTDNDYGFRYYDETLGKPIYWNGLSWIDGNGNYIFDNSGSLQNRCTLTSPIKGQQFKLTREGESDVYLIYGDYGWLNVTNRSPWFDDSGDLNTMYDKYNYTLLTEEPDDWPTKYNTYYKVVNGVYTLLTTLETWAIDTYYKKDVNVYKGVQVKLTDTDVELLDKVVKWNGTKYINIVDNVALKAGTPVVTFTTENNTTTATITSTSSGKIYYTKDGSTPTSSSTEYSSVIPLADGDQVKAICIRDHMDNSNVGFVPVAKPVIKFNDGILHIECDTPDAKIYYTTDGNPPSTSSTVYDSSASVTIAAGITVKAFATLIGRVNSNVASNKRS